jgi:hypothetical protein
MRAVKAQPAYCLETNCRFARGYATDLRLAPPAEAVRLPNVFAFEIERENGYRHYGEHHRPNGGEIVELLRSVWAFTIHTVLRDGKSDSQDPDGSLIWILDGQTFRELLDTGRLKLATTRCSSYRDGWHCCVRCTEDARPTQHTLRSVQQYSFVDAASEVVYSRLAGRELEVFLSGALEHRVNERFRIASYPLFKRPWHDRPFHFSVPIHVDDYVVEVLVIASRPERRKIEEDQAAFIAAHEVMFTKRLANGHMGASFVERQ